MKKITQQPETTANKLKKDKETTRLARKAAAHANTISLVPSISIPSPLKKKLRAVTSTLIIPSTEDKARVFELAKGACWTW